ncbi:septum formation inhibitor Maf, partial [bacterium]|nr:septum formation inhibitor Maf [bacterium]
LINTSNGQLSTGVVRDRLRFRSLSEDSIQRYVEKEQPLDCAGSIKTESLGIALIEEMSCQDPNHLIGLPLIALCSLLEKHGLNIV